VVGQVAGFSGSLGIRVDPSRAHVGKIGGTIALEDPLLDSQLHTWVDYTDGSEPFQDDGDGMFWPFDFQDMTGQRPCGWLGPAGAQRAPISIDDFNDL
jgi:hypothetical protein